MCRQLAYIGPDRFVHEVVLQPPHGLEHQAYAANELMTGVVAADGFGAAWYQDDVGETPAVYRSTLPVWADRSFASVAAHVRAHTVVASVRNATEAGTTAEPNVHPFDDGRHTLVHNGFLESYRTAWMRRLRARLNERQYGLMEGVTESETLFRLIRTRMEDEGRSLRDATLEVVREVLSEARERDLQAQLNLVISDGRILVATRASAKGPSNSAYLHTPGGSTPKDRWPEASLVSSEPMDDSPGWVAQEHGTCVVLHAGEPPGLHRI